MTGMTSSEGLLRIGEFARAAGVTPSLLRFYAGCGLVVPAHVDPRTGYRLYSPDQAQRVALVRRLREMGLPLPAVARALSAPLPEAEALIGGRLAQLEAEVRAARAAAAAATLLLRQRPTDRPTVDAAAFGAAVHRVAPAAAGSPGAPVLAGVLVEVSAGELHLVATDRYRLAVQTLPLHGTADDARVVLPAGALTDLADWSGNTGRLGVRVSGQGLAGTRADGGTREVAALAGRYPDHRVVLSALGDPVTRVTAGRTALLAALSADPVSRLRIDPAGGLRVGRAPVPGAASGQPMSVAFRRTTLRPAVLASLGPDVVLELTRPDAPALVSSADDSTFSTVVMPTREPAGQVA